MIVRLFRSQQPLGYIFLGLAVLATWTAGFLSGKQPDAASMPLFGFLLSGYGPGTRFVYFLAGMLLTGVQALQLNSVINRHEVLYKHSWFPGLMYLLLAGSIPEFVSIHPVLVVNSMLIPVLNKIFRLYNSDAPLPLVFDSCLLISLASLFYPPASAFFLLFAAGLIILRPFSWRNWVVSLMGLATPVFFYALYYFLSDNLGGLLAPVKDSGIADGIRLVNAWPAGYSVTAGFVLLLLALSLLKIRVNYYRNVTRVRNFQQVVFLGAVTGLIMILITPREPFFRFHILSVPLAVLLSYYFLEAKKIWFAELLLYAFAGIIAFNFIVAGN